MVLLDIMYIPGNHAGLQEQYNDNSKLKSRHEYSN